MSYSSFIFRQASIPLDTIPYVIVGQGTVNVLATISAVGINTCLYIVFVAKYFVSFFTPHFLFSGFDEVKNKTSCLFIEFKYALLL